MVRTTVLFVVSLVFLTPVQTPDRRKDAAAVLEGKLHGEWKGGDCVGDWTFKSDGTFDLLHYSPGNNTLTGTWYIRWNALPPTLVTTCKASDYVEYVGKTWEMKLTRLDDDGLSFQHPGGGATQYERVKK
jgi:hypothetical protein